MAGRSVDFTFHNLSVGVTKKGYGLMIQGNSPVVIEDVLPQSVADKAGVRNGDYLIVLNGKDVQFATEDEIGSTLQSSFGAALELRVARPHPTPATDLEKRKAIITLQTKLRTGDYVTCGNEVNDYRSKLTNAMASVDDILGGFNLPDDQMVPRYGGTEQEVEIKMLGNDSDLSSPPSSKGSEVELTYDPFLDFSRENKYDHHPGVKGAGAAIRQSTEQFKEEMAKMNGLLRDISAKSEKKKKAKEQTNPLMRAEAAYDPNYPSNRPKPQLQTQSQSSATVVTKPDWDQDLAELDQLEKELSTWVQSPLSTGAQNVSNNQSVPWSGPKRTKSPLSGQTKPTQRAERGMSPNSKRELSSPYEEKDKRPSRKDGRSASPLDDTVLPTTVQQRKRQSSKSREKSPPVTELERNKSPPPKQTEHDISSSERAVSPNGKSKTSISDRLFRRSKSPQSQLERSTSPPVQPTQQASSQSRKSSVPLRSKKQPLPVSEAVGRVYNVSGNSGSSSRSESIKPSASVGVNQDVGGGLPDRVYDWGKDDVGQWLKQLSESLHEQYRPLFSKHQITGRTLLRLDGSKLKGMGITNTVHCRILGKEIAKLRIRQEQAELREFQLDSDDESGVVTSF